MPFSKSISKTTYKLIIKFGNDIVYKETVKGIRDPDTGLTNDIETDYNIKGLISNYSSSELIDGVINIEDLSVMVWAGLFDVKKSDKIVIDGIEWNIINIETLITQNKKIYYKLQIRA